jgi:hypothetical protein
MSRLVGLALLALATAAEAANCKTDGVFVFPRPGSVIPTNSRFILEGAGKEKDRVEKLAATDELVLKADDDAVLVKVGKTLGVDFWTSQMNRVAVVLTPARALLPRRQYTLLLEKALPGTVVLNDNPTLSWMTGGGGRDLNDPRASGMDKTAPKYLVKPAVTEGFYRKDGDGLSRYLKVTATLAEDAPAYFVISLKRARGPATEQHYWAPIRSGEATLGHDECSGGFSFDDGRAYKLMIETFDSAGNKCVEALKPIEAQAPRPGLE